LTQITMLVSGAKGECVVAGGEVNKFQALLWYKDFLSFFTYPLPSSEQQPGNSRQLLNTYANTTPTMSHLCEPSESLAALSTVRFQL
jgi:hypothetical protein